MSYHALEGCGYAGRPQSPSGTLILAVPHLPGLRTGTPEQGMDSRLSSQEEVPCWGNPRLCLSDPHGAGRISSSHHLQSEDCL
jgi:hypothetical protein